MCGEHQKQHCKCTKTTDRLLKNRKFCCELLLWFFGYFCFHVLFPIFIFLLKFPLKWGTYGFEEAKRCRNIKKKSATDRFKQQKRRLRYSGVWIYIYIDRKRYGPVPGIQHLLQCNRCRLSVESQWAQLHLSVSSSPLKYYRNIKVTFAFTIACAKNVDNSPCVSSDPTHTHTHTN